MTISKSKLFLANGETVHFCEENIKQAPFMTEFPNAPVGIVATGVANLFTQRTNDPLTANLTTQWIANNPRTHFMMYNPMGAFRVGESYDSRARETLHDELIILSVNEACLLPELFNSFKNLVEAHDHTKSYLMPFADQTFMKNWANGCHMEHEDFKAYLADSSFYLTRVIFAQKIPTRNSIQVVSWRFKPDHDFSDLFDIDQEIDFLDFYPDRKDLYPNFWSLVRFINLEDKEHKVNQVLTLVETKVRDIEDEYNHCLGMYFLGVDENFFDDALLEFKPTEDTFGVLKATPDRIGLRNAMQNKTAHVGIVSPPFLFATYNHSNMFDDSKVFDVTLTDDIEDQKPDACGNVKPLVLVTASGEVVVKAAASTAVI